MLPYFGNDVFPGCQRNHVTGITAETVHAPPAPGDKDIRHVLPQARLGIIQFGQIFPGNAPGAGNLDTAFGASDQPVRMSFMQTGGPAGVIDGNVDQDFGIALMDRVHQFDKLLQRRCVRIKFSQGGVNSGKAQSGVRTAESSHAPIGCRCGVDWQQQKNSASEFTDNKVELPNEIAKGSGGRNNGIAVFVQFTDRLFIRRRQLLGSGFIGAKLPHKGIINDVGTAGIGRFNIDGGIWPRRPCGLRFTFF